MSGYDLEYYLKGLTMTSWCPECNGHIDPFIHRPYSQSPDTVRIAIECRSCDFGIIIEVKD
jgi:hypothetical protein